MSGSTTAKRSYGSGSLLERPDRPGYWYGQWWLDGRRVKRRLGPIKSKDRPEGLTRRQAEAALREAMQTVAAENVRSLRSEKRSTGKLIAEVLDAYLADHTDIKQHTTAHDYRRTCRNWFEPFFGDLTVDKITADDVRALKAHMLSTRLRNHGQAPGAGLAPKSVRNHLALLSTLLLYAVDRGWAEKNVAARVPRPGDGGEEAGLRFFEPHEITDLVAHALDGPYREVDRALYVTASQTGLRLGELRALRWASVDLVQNVVRVERGVTRGVESSPKSRRGRAVPLSRAVCEVLAGLPRRSELVFADPHTGGRLTDTALRRRYCAARDAAGLAALPFHSLRHSFGTTLARSGWPVGDIQALMGHANLATTEIYMHYAPRHDQAQRIDAAFAVADPRLDGAAGTSGANSGANVASPGVPERTSAHLNAA